MPSLAANAALGGGVAVLGGGKFENDAITGAFGYLFNAAGGRALGHVVGAVVGGIGGVETGPGDVLVALAVGHALGEIFSRVEDSIYGVIYVRTDAAGGEYVGQAQSQERYETRQVEHQADDPTADYTFHEWGAYLSIRNARWM
jgi:hypothetical protein